MSNKDPPITTKREREVLLWLSRGKSAEDVGTILDITASTVMFHYRSAAKKYGTATRTQTVVEAIRRGDVALN